MHYFSCHVKNAFGRSFLFISLAMLLSSCASVGGPALQPQVNSLFAAGDLKAAQERIMAREADYGHGNYVLYHLDRGLILQMNGDLEGSIRSLDKAKTRDEELYTRSISKEAASWVLNDNSTPYRTPEYERVLINVFQMFNYVQMNELDEALVEARDLDVKFPVVPEIYGQQKESFEDNGFARLLSGILFEAAGTPQDLNDAFIAYKQALVVYDAYYGGGYVPRTLQEGLLRLAVYFGDENTGRYRARFHEIAQASPDRTAVVYFLVSAGLSPVKVSEDVPVPLGDGLVTKIAFPKFVDRGSRAGAFRLVFQPEGGEASELDAELGVDISELADKDLGSRKLLMLSKAALRPALKYLVLRQQKAVIAKKSDSVAAGVFTVLGDLYNLWTEQADVRSWQALPGKVLVGRKAVRPGQYHLKVAYLDVNDAALRVEEALGDQVDKGLFELKAGRTYFVIHRSLP